MLNGEGAHPRSPANPPRTAVFESGEQVEAAFEMRSSRASRVSTRTPRRSAYAEPPLPAQEDRLAGLADVATIVPHRVQPRDHGREELAQAICRDITHGPPEEAALHSPQRRGEVVREGIANIVLKEEPKPWVHDGDIGRLNAGEKSVKLLIFLETSLDMRAKPVLALNPKRWNGA